MKDGIGYFVEDEFCKYLGEFKENLKNGYGVYQYSFGLIYEGYFKDNQFHGLGVIFKNGQVV